MGKGLTEDEIKALIDGEVRQAVGYFGGRLANMRQKALVYYEGLPSLDLSPPEVEGRSTVVATEVRNVIQSILPTLMEKFSAGEDVVSCEPSKEGDEQAAKDATEYLNHIFYKEHNGHKLLETAFLDGLISKCGFIKIWWDTRVVETKEEYAGLNEIELAEILDDEEVEPISHDQYEDEEAQEQKAKAVASISQQLEQAIADSQMNPQAKQAVPVLQQQLAQVQSMPVPMLHDVVCKRSKQGGRLCIENVPPEELLVSRKMKSLDWEREPFYFVAHRVARTQSELASMGYKNVEDITSDDNQTMSSLERIERLTWDDDMAYMTSTDTPSYDPSQRLIWVTEAYLKADIDGTGVANLVKVTKAGNTILDMEEIDFPPFVMFRPIVMPHRFFGMSVADLAMEPQRIKTNVLRAILDNLSFQVNSRFFAVEGQVNLDDLLVSRPGSVVRVRQPGAVGVLTQGGNDSTGAMNVLQYMQGYTEEATGWSRTANAADDPNSINLTATAANLASNKANQRIDMIARNYAEGLVDLFKLMLKLIIQNQKHSMDVKLGKGWTKLDPREWRNQFSLTINVGLGTGSKDQQVQHLMMMLQAQKEALALGLTTPENIYNSLKQLSSALGFKNPDPYWTDPTQHPHQPQPNPEMMKIQAQQQMENQKLQAQMQLEREKAQIEVQKIMQEQQAQAAEREKELQLEAQRNALQAQHEAQLAQMKADQDARVRDQEMAFNEWKAKLEAETKIVTAKIAAGAKGTELGDEPSSEEIQSQAVLAAMQGLTQAIQGMTMAHAAPKKLVVNPDGSKMVVPVQ